MIIIFYFFTIFAMVLEIQDVHASFTTGFRNTKRKHVLQGVNLSIQWQEIHGLLGQNGVGKTTLIQCIMGFVQTNAGTITIEWKKLGHETIQHIGYAPDNTHYYSFLTGIEHLIHMGQLSGDSRENCIKKWIQILEKVWLQDAKDTHVKKYSAGMKKRLGIALSLINSPTILIRDEPMNGVDPLGRILLKSLMKELKAAGKTIIFSTHILSDVEEIADRFSILHSGKIAYTEETKKIRQPLEVIFQTYVQNTSSQKA